MIGETLRLIRVINGVKANDLAKKLDISASYLSLIENGKKRPSLDIIGEYSIIFGVKVSSIMFLDEEMQDSKNGDILRKLTAPTLLSLLRMIGRQCEEGAD